MCVRICLAITAFSFACHREGKRREGPYPTNKPPTLSDTSTPACLSGCDLPTMKPSWNTEDDPCFVLEGKIFGDGASSCFKMGFLDGNLYYWWSDICYELLTSKAPYHCETIGTTAVFADKMWVDGSTFDILTGLIDKQLHFVDDLDTTNVNTWFPGQ